MSQKLNVLPRLPQPGSVDYERAMNRQLTVLFSQTAQQVNDLSEGRIAARYQAVDTMPSTGAYNAGDYVEKRTKAEAGTAGAKYVLMGWIRLTSGSSHVLNTDWVQDRRLTGN